MDSPASNVTRQISEALYEDRRTRKLIIDVSCNQGIVVLTGTVKSLVELQAAEEIARSQPGVVSVVNELKIG